MKRPSLTLLVNAPLEEDQRRRIRNLGVHLLDGLSEESLRVAEVIYTTRIPFEPRQVPRLRWIQLNTVAVDHILTGAVVTTGVRMANVRGAYRRRRGRAGGGSDGVAESPFPECSFSYSFRIAGPMTSPRSRARNCYGKTLSVVGYGSIGRHLASNRHGHGDESPRLQAAP